MSLFIIMIVAMGIRMASSSSELYEQDYYKQGEEYAERMVQEDLAKNVQANYHYNNNALQIKFLKGQGDLIKLKAIKLSNSDEDFIIKLNKKAIDSLTIPFELSKGLWVIEINGTIEGKEFFKKLELAK